MGLFDRFKTSQARAATRSLRRRPWSEPSPAQMRIVPDVDDEHRRVRGSVREHLARLTAAADSDIASLSPAEFDAALTSRLVGAERIQATGLGFSYALPVRRAHPRGAHPRPAHGGRHAARLAHRRDRAPHPQPGQHGPQQPARAARDHAGRRAAGRRGRPQRLRRDGRLPLHRELRALPQRRRAPLAARRRRPQRLRLRRALPPRDHPPAVLDAGRDPRRASSWCPTTRSGCTTRAPARCRCTPTTGWAGRSPA